MFCACSIRKSLSVSGTSSDTSVLSSSRDMKRFLVVPIAQVCVLPRLCVVSIASNERLISSGVLSSPLVGKLESESAAWC